MGKTKAKPPEPFTETTPPPRVRPQGTPLAALIDLPPGEDVSVLFTVWDKQGRFPEGSILATFVGCQDFDKAGRQTCPSGYRLLPQIEGREGLPIPPEKLEAYKVHTVIRQKLERDHRVILSPREVS